MQMKHHYTYFTNKKNITPREEKINKTKGRWSILSQYWQMEIEWKTKCKNRRRQNCTLSVIGEMRSARAMVSENGIEGKLEVLNKWVNLFTFYFSLMVSTVRLMLTRERHFGSPRPPKLKMRRVFGKLRVD